MSSKRRKSIMREARRCFAPNEALCYTYNGKTLTGDYDRMCFAEGWALELSDFESMRKCKGDESEVKTFGLIIHDEFDFLCVDDGVVKTEAANHEQAMGYFLSHYQDELIGLTLQTFCFDDESQKYGYEYAIIGG